MSITTKELIAEVLKVAEKNPDYIYTDNSENTQGCSYNADTYGNREGTPCIIGQAFRNLGVVVDEEYENFEIRELLDGAYVDVVSVDPVDDAWLGLVQFKQDTGCSWGDSVLPIDVVDVS